MKKILLIAIIICNALVSNAAVNDILFPGTNGGCSTDYPSQHQIYYNFGNSNRWILQQDNAVVQSKALPHYLYEGLSFNLTNYFTTNFVTTAFSGLSVGCGSYSLGTVGRASADLSSYVCVDIGPGININFGMAPSDNNYRPELSWTFIAGGQHLNGGNTNINYSSAGTLNVGSTVGTNNIFGVGNNSTSLVPRISFYLNTGYSGGWINHNEQWYINEFPWGNGSGTNYAPKYVAGTGPTINSSGIGKICANSGTISLSNYVTEGTISSTQGGGTVPMGTFSCATYSVGQNLSSNGDLNTSNLTAGTYTIIYDDDSQVTYSFNITIVAQPTLSLSPTSKTVCYNETTSPIYTATASGSTSYSYYWSCNNSGSISTSTNQATFQNSNSAGSYTLSVYVTDNNSCNSTTHTATATVRSQPSISISVAETSGTTNNDGTTCSGDGVTLTGSGAGTGGTYSWNTGDNTAAITKSPTSTTTYSVTGTDSYGCYNATATTKQITVNSLPSISTGSDVSICPGKSTGLSSSGAGTGGSYSWSPTTGLSNSNVYNPTATPSATTTYTVTGTDANKCKNTASQKVTIYTAPSLSLNPGNKTICTQSDLAYTGTASGGNNSSYTFTTSGTAATHLNNVTTTSNIWNGTFNDGGTQNSYLLTLTVTDGNSCTASQNSNITENGLPSPNITVTETSGTANNDGTTCSGDAVTLTATGAGTGGSYSWNTGDVTAVIVKSPTSTTTYTVTAKNSNNCTAQVQQIISVNSLPNITAGVDKSSICPNGTANLTSSGAGSGGSYSWSPTTGLSDANSYNPSATISATTTYTVTGMDANNCKNTATQKITVYTPPSLNLSPGNVTICSKSDQAYTGTASGGNGSSYTFTTSGTGSTHLTNVTTTSNIWNGTFNDGGTLNSYLLTLTVTDGNSCTASQNSNITENSLPTPSISITETSGTANNDGTTCSGDAVTLTATGAGTSGTYSWNTGEVTAAIAKSPSINTTYTVTAKNTNNCTAQAQQLITVNALPNISASVDKSSICPNSTANLTSSGAGSGGSYSWSPTTGLSDANSYNPSATISATTTYTVTGTDANKCKNTANQKITVYTPPSLSLSPGNTTICSKSDLPFTGTASGGNSSSYMFTASGTASTHLSNTSATSNIWNSTFNDGGVFNSYTLTLTVSDGNSCTASQSTIITENSLPTPSIGISEISGTANNDGTTCSGDAVTLTANGAGVGGSYSWNTGDVTAAITKSPLNSTNYIVVAKNSNNCTAQVSQLITVNALPNITAYVDKSSICPGSSANLFANGAGVGGSYSWSPIAGLSASNIYNPSASPSGTTIYTVTGTDINVCSNSATQKITVLPQPNISFNPLNESICKKQSVNYTVSANGGNSSNYSFSWSGTGEQFLTNEKNYTNTATAVYNATITGNYTVIIYVNDGTCTSSSTSNVTVNGLPKAIMTLAESSGTTKNDGIICPADSVTLSASGAGIGGSYAWDNGAITQVNIVNPLATSTVYAYITDVNGCKDTASRLITVNNKPIIAISLDESSGVTANDGIICQGDTIVLSASGAGIGGLYKWNTGEGTATIIKNPGGTTAYTVVATDANKCSASNLATIYVNSLPSVGLSSTNNSICQNSSVNLTAKAIGGSGSGYTFSWAGTGGTLKVVQSVNPAIDNYTGTVPGNNLISVLVADGNKCYASSNKTITVNSLPATKINISESSGNFPNDGRICIGSMVQLTASGGLNYSWDNGLPSTAIVTVYPTTKTNYTVTAIDGNNCQASKTVTLNVDSLPKIGIKEYDNSSLAVNDSLVCSGDLAILIASGGVTYQWNNGLPATATVNIYPKIQTTYNVTVTDANNCSNVGSRTIFVKPLPIGVIFESDNSGKAKNDSTICQGDSAKLTVSGGTKYAWAGGLGTTNIINVSPASTFSYSVAVTDNNNCTSNTSKLVIVRARPNAGIVESDSSGTSKNDGVICYNGTASLTATGGSTYYWFGGLGYNKTVNVSATKNTNYSVAVTDTNKCSDTAIYTLNVLVNLTSGSVGSPQDICYKTSPLALGTTVAPGGGSGNWNFKWQISSDGLIFSNILGSDALTESYQPPVLTKDVYYRRVNIQACGFVNTVPVKIDVMDSITQGQIVFSDKTTANTICYNTNAPSVTSFVNANGGSGKGIYKWYYSTNMNTNSNSWLYVASTNGSLNYGILTDSIQLKRQYSDSVCGAIGFSNPVIVKVRPKNLPGSVGYDKTICNGFSSDTLVSITPASGGENSPSYKWFMSKGYKTVGDTSWDEMVGNNIAFMYPVNLKNTTYYTRQAYDKCDTLFSNVVTIHVRGKLDAGAVNIDNANKKTFCFNAIPDPIHSTNLANGGTGNFRYSWVSTTDNSLLPGAFGWNNIANANDTAYQPSRLKTNTYFVRVATDFVCGTVYTPRLSINILDSLNGGLVGQSQYVCSGQSGQTLFSISSPSGGKGNYSVSWYNTKNTFAKPGDGNWYLIAGNNLFSETGNLTSTTQSVRVVTDDCGLGYSNPIVLTVKPALQGGLLTNPLINTICNNYNAPLLASYKPATGGLNKIIYDWYYTTNTAATTYDSTWVSMDSTRESIYPGQLIQTTKFIRRAVDSICMTPANSNIVTVNVNAPLQGGMVFGSKNICSSADGGRIGSLSLPTGGSGKYFYTWPQTNDSSALQGSAFYTKIPVNDTGYNVGVLTKSTYYYREVTDGVCKEPAYSNIIPIVVKSVYAPGTLTGVQSICYHQIPSIIMGTQNNYIDASLSWQKSSDAVNWMDIPGVVGKDIQLKNLDSSLYIRRIMNTLKCGIISTDPVRITVREQLDSVMLTLKQRYCRGENIKLNVPMSFNSYTVWYWNGNTIRNQTLEIDSITNTQKFTVYNQDTNKCRSNSRNYVLAVDSVKAAFHYDINNIEVGDAVDFINDSKGATQYKWNFCKDCEPITDKNTWFYFDWGGNFSVKLYAYSPYGCADTMTVANAIYVEDKGVKTDVKDKSEYLFIYPNPTANVLSIEGNSIIGKKLSIISSEGIEVLIKDLKTTSNKVDVSSLKPSIYIVRVGDKQFKMVKL